MDVDGPIGRGAFPDGPFGFIVTLIAGVIVLGMWLMMLAAIVAFFAFLLGGLYVGVVQLFGGDPGAIFR